MRMRRDDGARAQCRATDFDDVIFHTACQYGMDSVVRDMLGAHAGCDALDVHVHDDWAFAVACRNGHVDVVQQLTALQGERAVQCPDSLQQGFAAACSQGHVDVVKHLLTLPDARGAVVSACAHRAARCVVAAGHADVLRELLQHPWNGPLANTEALHEAHAEACALGYADVVTQLLALTGPHAVDVNFDSAEEDPERVGYEWDGGSPLVRACRGGHPRVVRQLLALPVSRGLDVHANGDCAFETACVQRHPQVACELLNLRGSRAVCHINQRFFHHVLRDITRDVRTWRRCNIHMHADIAPHMRAAVCHEAGQMLWKNRRHVTAARRACMR